MIVKDISAANINIDKEGGKIWVNSSSCVLRIQNLIFKNIEEKFSMIDVHNSEVTMYKEPLNSQIFLLDDFINDMVRILSPYFSSYSEKKEIFLEKLKNEIKQKIEEEYKNDNS